VEYILPLINFFCTVTVRKPEFQKYCKKIYTRFFLGLEPTVLISKAVSKNHITERSQNSYFSEPSVVEMLKDPYATCSCVHEMSHFNYHTN